MAVMKVGAARTAQGVTAVNPGPAEPRYRQKSEPMSSYSQAAEAEIESPHRWAAHTHGRRAPILLATSSEICGLGLGMYEYVIW